MAKKTVEKVVAPVAIGFKTTNAKLVDELQAKGFNVVGIVPTNCNNFLITYEFKQSAEEMGIDPAAVVEDVVDGKTGKRTFRGPQA
jgi:hypothetical protein